jgi:hypothetical protein
VAQFVAPGFQLFSEGFELLLIHDCGL